MFGLPFFFSLAATPPSATPVPAVKRPFSPQPLSGLLRRIWTVNFEEQFKYRDERPVNARRQTISPECEKCLCRKGFLGIEKFGLPSYLGGR